MVFQRSKCDEFYTLYEIIEKIYKSGYMKPEVFKDKIIYCNCDDYRWSNYVKFWKNNFEYFGIKKLIATNYDNGDGAYIYTYDGKNETIEQGIEDGSFEHYSDFIKDDTIVVTNPPFSRSRDYFNFLNNNDAKFYVHSSLVNVIKCLNDLNDIYCLYKGDYCWYELDGIKKFVAASGVVTNVGSDKTSSKVKLTKTFDEVKHDFYYEEDFYKVDKWKGKILNVDWSNKIPYDYDEFIGVPISFLYVQPELRRKYHIYGTARYGRKFFRLRIKKIK